MPLPCRFFSPASITDHLELSTITGTRAMSGSEATSRRNFTIAASESSSPSSMLTSMICAPLSTCWRATSSAASYCPSRISRANFRDPVTLVRSPTFTKLVSGPMVSGSIPERRQRGGRCTRARGATPRTASAMARMVSGVVPQQPPTMFTSPLVANSRITAAMLSGVSSYPPKTLGRPAFGCALTGTGAIRARSWTYCRSCLAPRAQLSPTLSGRAWLTAFQKASTVWPDSVRPLASVIVPEIITGTRCPERSNWRSIAKIAALALRVSKIVSTISRSAPPSSSPAAASP